jgi:hypothetical protein
LIRDFVGALSAAGEDVVDVRFVAEDFFAPFLESILDLTVRQLANAHGVVDWTKAVGEASLAEPLEE